jgi:hypothetical protein
MAPCPSPRPSPPLRTCTPISPGCGGTPCPPAPDRRGHPAGLGRESLAPGDRLRAPRERPLPARPAPPSARSRRLWLPLGLAAAVAALALPHLPDPGGRAGFEAAADRPPVPQRAPPLIWQPLPQAQPLYALEGPAGIGPQAQAARGPRGRRTGGHPGAGRSRRPAAVPPLRDPRRRGRGAVELLRRSRAPGGRSGAARGAQRPSAAACHRSSGPRRRRAPPSAASRALESASATPTSPSACTAGSAGPRPWPWTRAIWPASSTGSSRRRGARIRP